MRESDDGIPLTAEPANDKEFRRSLTDWNSYVETLTQKIIEVDDTIPELPVKDIIFRIYRDIRFSKDPTPYKVRLHAGRRRSLRLPTPFLPASND